MTMLGIIGGSGLYHMAGLKSGQYFRMGQMNALGIARVLDRIKNKFLALFEHHGTVCKNIKPQFRTLQINHDADRTADFAFHFADHRHLLPHAVMRSMAHIDAEDVHARLEQRAHLLHRVGGRAQSGQDLCFSAAAHRKS